MPKISELPALAKATSEDLIPIVDDAGNITKKVRAADSVPLKGVGLGDINGGSTAGVLTTDASGAVNAGKATAQNIESTTSVDANGWTVTKVSSNVTIYQKAYPEQQYGAVTGVAFAATLLPVGTTWATVSPYIQLSSRSTAGVSGASNDIRLNSRANTDSTKFDILITASAITYAFITATIIKVG